MMAEAGDVSLSTSIPGPAAADTNTKLSGIGRSAIEMLPMELIHDIHFMSPNNALLATSKTMYANFTSDVLPAARTAQWLAYLWGNRAEQGTKSVRPTFILKRKYVHSKRMLRCILRELDLPPGYRVLYYPPLDPSDFIVSGGWLPVDLLHHLYHTYPTDPACLSQAVRHLLLRRRYDEAHVLLSLGADPRSSHTDVLQPAEVYFLPDHAVSYLRKVDWSPKWLRKRTCECGWAGMPTMPTTAQSVMLRVSAQALRYASSPETMSRSIYKFIGSTAMEEADAVKIRAESDDLDEDPALRYPANDYSPWIQSFMLPFSGTVGKFPVQLQDKYSDVVQILKLPLAPEHGRMTYPVRMAYEQFLQHLVTAVCKDYWMAYRAILQREVTE